MADSRGRGKTRADYEHVLTRTRNFLIYNVFSAYLA